MKGEYTLATKLLLIISRSVHDLTRYVKVRDKVVILNVQQRKNLISSADFFFLRQMRVKNWGVGQYRSKYGKTPCRFPEKHEGFVGMLQSTVRRYRSYRRNVQFTVYDISS